MSYYIQQIEIDNTIPPLQLIYGLLNSDFVKEPYFVYEMEDKFFIGLGAFKEITFNSDGTGLISTESESIQFTSKQIATDLSSLIDRLGIKGWRLFGTMCFEFANHLFHIPIPHREDRIEQPLLRLVAPLIDIEISKGNIQICSLDHVDDNWIRNIENYFEEICGSKRFPKINVEEHIVESVFSDDDKEEYKRKVKTIVEKINNGDLVKAILSRKIDLPENIDLVASYFLGRSKNTPARSYIVKTADIEAIGYSPETVVEIKPSGLTLSNPLAGTRSLGKTLDEEQELKKELLDSNKELAEHSVAVSQSILDMKKVCNTDSVVIKEFMQIARRGSVQHLASLIAGQKRSDKSVWEVLRALFPAPTASGIDKILSIKAIQELESCDRLLYGGCVLRADSTGFLDAALVLRTLFKHKNKAWTQVGAGIMDTSDPEREFTETCEKLESMGKYIVLKKD